ncbi:MAG: hypothetical protein Q8Q73_19005 [Stagnimonas sp.]|nr:hypothetical protein [Stagnimonas sp.]
MVPHHPPGIPRPPLIRSVTYVRALFPWELRDVSAANDALCAPPARVFGFAPRPAAEGESETAAPPFPRP